MPDISFWLVILLSNVLAEDEAFALLLSSLPIRCVLLSLRKLLQLVSFCSQFIVSADDIVR